MNEDVFPIENRDFPASHLRFLGCNPRRLLRLRWNFPRSIHHPITPSTPSPHHPITPSPHHPITPSPHHPITTPPPDPSSYLLERSHLKLPKCDHRGHAHEKTGLLKKGGIQEKKTPGYSRRYTPWILWGFGDVSEGWCTSLRIVKDIRTL